jgi:hypothetical protein
MEEPEELGRGYLPALSSVSEHGDHGWKALEEKNGIETPNEGIDSPKKNENFESPPWVCYKLVSEHKTTLGLLGLMHESYENISGGL